MLGILTSLAGFSMKNPKTILFGAVGVLLFGLHYKLLVGERDKLRVAEAGYKRAVTAFVAREETLQDDLRLEREAAQSAVNERDAARIAIDVFRSARTDTPSLQWAAQSVPVAEIERLCAALPDMEGCS